MHRIRIACAFIIHFDKVRSYLYLDVCVCLHRDVLTLWTYLYFILETNETP